MDNNIKSSKQKINLMLDAEGTLMAKKGDPKTILRDSAKVDIYFLGNPSGKPDDVKAKAHEIIDRYNLGELSHLDIDAPGNVYVKCDILCEVLLDKLGVKAEDMNSLRAEIESEVKDVREPKLFEMVMAKYPEVAISVLTTASPYQKSAYQQIVSKYSDRIGVIISQEEGYKKDDPKLYSHLVDKYGERIVLVDDTEKNVAAAKEVEGSYGKQYVKEEATLTETTETAIDESLDL